MPSHKPRLNSHACAQICQNESTQDTHTHTLPLSLLTNAHADTRAPTQTLLIVPAVYANQSVLMDEVVTLTVVFGVPVRDFNSSKVRALSAPLRPSLPLKTHAQVVVAVENFFS